MLQPEAAHHKSFPPSHAPSRQAWLCNQQRHSLWLQVFGGRDKKWCSPWVTAKMVYMAGVLALGSPRLWLHLFINLPATEVVGKLIYPTAVAFSHCLVFFELLNPSSCCWRSPIVGFLTTATACVSVTLCLTSQSSGRGKEQRYGVPPAGAEWPTARN